MYNVSTLLATALFTVYFCGHSQSEYQYHILLEVDCFNSQDTLGLVLICWAWEVQNSKEGENGLDFSSF